VLEGTPETLPTAQKTSLDGNWVKSAVEQEGFVALGEAAEDTRDIVGEGSWEVLASIRVVPSSDVSVLALDLDMCLTSDRLLQRRYAFRSVSRVIRVIR